ncbi:BZ3500_MvSof-1268-A1-R1_Chr7-1g09195 [Microbotryum saponariae]|uniref:BZ3500_MvSof-1268-A1-R1_Chr7-1g09195 protein n=1 Tax=Microbotryum saponariae TaxID=289078 RepID=A0A2X0LDP6_9BASI|nr:BZ3501_MvSof-1269-A2-R1_Chr7-1g08900 [Microbotryum saponariae]SDA02978.1 BZ3500_MvSof-1268-A1-R1_Chr7-1g09195 [Microbotryum saponariae]
MSTGSVAHSLRTAFRSHQSWTGPVASTSRLISLLSPSAGADSVAPAKAARMNTTTTAGARHFVACTCSPTRSAAMQTRSYSSRPTPRAGKIQPPCHPWIS